MYIMVALIVFSALFSNCVYVAVILSYCGQCKLLSYYIQGVKERLEEKTTELRTAMQVDCGVFFQQFVKEWPALPFLSFRKQQLHKEN